jgi:L-ribulose-5-phosphate 4-epimerase
VKAAVLAEDVARSTHLAFQLAGQHGTPEPIPQEAVDRLFERYQNVYGQN